MAASRSSWRHSAVVVAMVLRLLGQIARSPVRTLSSARDCRAGQSQLHKELLHRLRPLQTEGIPRRTRPKRKTRYFMTSFIYFFDYSIIPAVLQLLNYNLIADNRFNLYWQALNQLRPIETDPAKYSASTWVDVPGVCLIATSAGLAQGCPRSPSGSVLSR